MLEEAQGMERSMLDGVTALGEVDQQRRMHAHFLLMWLDTSGHPATRNARSRRGGERGANPRRARIR